MEAKRQEEYDADLYLRLSREDGDKAESDSIANQRELLMDYLSSHPEIRLHEVRTDDGYSGVNYDRPGFIQMMGIPVRLLVTGQSSRGCCQIYMPGKLIV